LGTPRPRPAGPAGSSADNRRRRRLAVTGLAIASLALLSVYFRESSGGALHQAQSTGASILYPFQVAADRVAQPFEDAAGWTGDVLGAKSENEELRSEIDRLRQQVVQSQTAARQNAELRRLLKYRDGPAFPRDYRGVAARIIGRTPGQFEQQVVIAAGSNAGVRLNDPVVTAGGLVGRWTRVARRSACVTLLTDETSAVSALDLKTNAAGIVRHGVSSGETLVLDRVTKENLVRPGDVVITAGWRSGKLASIYPRGIPIGAVTFVGQLDTDIYKQVEVDPLVDFSALDSVLVLVDRPKAKPAKAGKQR
jgi:rod shape-determining protein MreC